jgi:hypothetical protein
MNRIVNKQLNRQGFYWAEKFSTTEEAVALKKKLGIGAGQLHYVPRSKRPYWVMVQHPYQFPEE